MIQGPLQQDLLKVSSSVQDSDNRYTSPFQPKKDPVGTDDQFMIFLNALLLEFRDNPAPFWKKT